MHKERPFEPRIPAVFLPVADLSRSIAWYSRLLGLPMPQDHPESFYLFRLSGGANLFLERSERVTPSGHVLFSIPAPEIEAARQFMQEYGIEIAAMKRHPDGSTIHFKDPDGHLLMACDI